MPITSLIEPIPGPDAGGIDLTFLPEFDAIQEARRADDPSLDQGEWARDLKTADWARVARLCHDTLRDRTKDLRIAGWYLEARTQIDGLPALAEGYELLAALCERLWTDLHPRGEDADERLGCLRWIVGQSPRWIRTAPLTGQDDTSLDTLTGVAERNADSSLDNDPKPTGWRVPLPSPFHDETRRVVHTALVAIDALEATVERRAPGEVPSMTAVRDALQDVLAAIAAARHRCARPARSKR